VCEVAKALKDANNLRLTRIYQVDEAARDRGCCKRPTVGEDGVPFYLGESVADTKVEVPLDCILKVPVKSAMSAKPPMTAPSTLNSEA